MTVYVSQNKTTGNYDVYIDERKKCDTTNLLIRAAKSRAKELIQNNSNYGGGKIIVEDLNGNVIDIINVQ